MSLPNHIRQGRAGLAVAAVVAVCVCGMVNWPTLRAAAPEDAPAPGAVWIDFGTNDVALRTQLLRTAQGAFLGMAEVKANGTGRVAQVTQQLFVPEAPGEDGLFHATGTHVFLFADGSSFSTCDEVLLAPTEQAGQFSMDGVLAITGGTGTLASVSGGLSLVGNIDLIQGQVSVDTRGKVQK